MEISILLVIFGIVVALIRSHTLGYAIILVGLVSLLVIRLRGRRIRAKH